MSNGVTYRVVDIPSSDGAGLGSGRLEEVLDAWALRVGGLLTLVTAGLDEGWVQDRVLADQRERAWGMVREGTRRLVELGKIRLGG